jgi:hypothetical protein
MSHKVGVWVDHRKAVIVFLAGGEVTTGTVESSVGPHARYSGRTEYPTPDGPQSGRGEKAFERRFERRLDRFYDEIIRRLGEPEALLIVGPGEAKLELRERLGRAKALSKGRVEVETTDKLTEPQLVAYVKRHYGLDRADREPPSR